MGDDTTRLRRPRLCISPDRSARSQVSRRCIVPSELRYFRGARPFPAPAKGGRQFRHAIGTPRRPHERGRGWRACLTRNRPVSHPGWLPQLGMSMSADGLERVWFLNTLVVIRVPPERGADRLCVLEHHAPKSDSPPLHVHHDQDEVFALLAGQARFHLSGRDLEARTGDCFLVPKGEHHSYLATSQRCREFWLGCAARGARIPAVVFD